MILKIKKNPSNKEALELINEGISKFVVKLNMKVEL